MNLKKQILLSVIVSLIIVTAISGSIAFTAHEQQDLFHLENHASEVIKGGFELYYLLNEYTLTGEPRVLIQLEERYVSLQPTISALNAKNPQEKRSISIIRESNEQIGQIIRDYQQPEESGTIITSLPATDPLTIWNRIQVQTLGLIYEAWQLRHLYHDDLDDFRFWNDIFIITLIFSMLAIISLNYLFISRRLVRSIEEVNAGSDAFSHGNLDYRIPVITDDEIGGIARRLNTMAKQIQSVTASRDELNREISERKQAEEALQTSQIKLSEAMDIADLVNWEFDVATGIFTFDDRFYALYGTTGELEGGSQMPAEVYAEKFVHPDDRHIVADEVKKAIEATDPEYISQMEHRIIRRDGEIRHIIVRFGIVKDENGRTVKTHGANQDITELKQKETALVEALKEKDISIKEIHHRVKNNLQVISSLIQMQQYNIEDYEYAQLFENLNNRVISIARVYENLIEREDFQKISIQNLVKDLISSALLSYPHKTDIKFDVDVIDDNLDLNAAVSLSMILSELFINIIKHAFVGMDKGHVKVYLQRDTDNGYLLEIGDDGVGYRGETDLSKAKTLGMKLVGILVEKDLHGTVDITVNGGTTFIIRFVP